MEQAAKMGTERGGIQNDAAYKHHLSGASKGRGQRWISGTDGREELESSN